MISGTGSWVSDDFARKIMCSNYVSRSHRQMSAKHARLRLCSPVWVPPSLRRPTLAAAGASSS